MIPSNFLPIGFLSNEIIYSCVDLMYLVVLEYCCQVRTAKFHEPLKPLAANI